MSQNVQKGMKTLFSFYSKKDVGIEPSSEPPSSVVVDNSPSNEQEQRPLQLQKLEDTIKHDPRLRQAIWKYLYREQDGVRRRFIQLGPCRPNLRDFPRNAEGHCFRYNWFKDYDWLEYSEATDKAYCFPCFLFESNTSKQHKQDAWISEGFNSWKRVCGKDSSLRVHEGGPSSLHANNVVMLDGLKRSSQIIEKKLTLQFDAQVKQNRLWVITTVNSILWLECQGCALRGNDESFDSSNRGNFLALLKYTATLNPQVDEVILENVPGNAIYTSPNVQNQILEIMGDLVRIKICEEIGDSKFCILVDESQDESNFEQMAIVLRFVDEEGFLRERFFDVVGVEDTTALTLKKMCSVVLDRNGLLVQNFRGQVYDGASNMQGAWSGLQSLFLQECRYAYYIHCFAHRLQLALVAASGELSDIELFFQMLTCIVNLVRASPKRNQQLKGAQRKEIEILMGKGELHTKGTSLSCQQNDEITLEYHYRFDILHETVDTQVMEISERFSDNTVELLRLCTFLDPKDCFKSLQIHDLCMLTNKYYPKDFEEMEINHQLRHQLQHYERDMRIDPDFKNILTLPELCQKLVKNKKFERYPLVDRLICLVLTLPVSTATTERAFSAIKLIKTPLRNKMGDELLANHMILYIERDIAISLDPEEIVDQFDFRENRIVRLR